MCSLNITLFSAKNKVKLKFSLSEDELLPQLAYLADVLGLLNKHSVSLQENRVSLI